MILQKVIRRDLSEGQERYYMLSWGIGQKKYLCAKFPVRTGGDACCFRVGQDGRVSQQGGGGQTAIGSKDPRRRIKGRAWEY